MEDEKTENGLTYDLQGHAPIIVFFQLGPTFYCFYHHPAVY